MASELDIIYPTPEYPRQLRLDSTSRCNASCLSCHRFTASSLSGEMNFYLLMTILKDIARWKNPLSEIIPVNYGELFMHSGWEEILNNIAFYLPHTNIVIPTNGAFLRPYQLRLLCSIPTIQIINFSVNAFFDETYEVFTGLHKENLEHIKSLCKLIKTWKPDIKIRISMVFDPSYQTDLERDFFKEEWKQYGEVWIIPAASAGRKDKEVKIIRKQPCRSIFSDIVVLSDGKLTSCCFDSGVKINCGIYSGDLHKDWHNKELTELRKIHNEHRRNEIELCSKCTFA